MPLPARLPAERGQPPLLGGPQTRTSGIARQRSCDVELARPSSTRRLPPRGRPSGPRFSGASPCLPSSRRSPPPAIVSTRLAATGLAPSVTSSCWARSWWRLVPRHASRRGALLRVTQPISFGRRGRSFGWGGKVLHPSHRVQLWPRHSLFFRTRCGCTATTDPRQLAGESGVASRKGRENLARIQRGLHPGRRVSEAAAACDLGRVRREEALRQPPGVLLRQSPADLP